MKKLLSILLVVALVATFAVGCSSKPDDGDGTTLKDGVYFAQEDTFAEGSGYKYFVVLTVADGKVTDADWSGTKIQPLGSKRTLSEAGKYGMDWHSQAAAAEKWLIENQDPTKFEDLYTDEEGHTDALKTDAGSAVSIGVSEFFELSKKALASTPVAKGTIATPADYVAFASLPVDEQGWEYKADFVVVNGTIMSSNFNAVFAGALTDDTAKYFGKDATGAADPKAPLSKVELGAAYGMNWDEQAAAADAFVVKNQGFTVKTDADGKTDEIASVSISVSNFEALFKAALGK
ncbi:MAG: hypothetical protein HGA49_11345 [Eubacteriaceae bacterium]|nr:hypothetical protein [Eubacteriaceae bacterium]